jgi:hypothetical protein
MEAEDRSGKFKSVLSGILQEDPDLWYDPLYRALADRTGTPKPTFPR